MKTNTAKPQIRNSNIKIRNKSEYRSTELTSKSNNKFSKQFWTFEFKTLILFRISYFGFRIYFQPASAQKMQLLKRKTLIRLY